MTDQPRQPLPTASSRRGRLALFAGWTLAAGFFVVVMLQDSALEKARALVRIQIEQVRKLKLEDGHRDALDHLRVVDLRSKLSGYATARLAIAWDPLLLRGVLTVSELPSAPANQAYHLWILDPGAPAPLDAGEVNPGDSHGFYAPRLTTQLPGFALTLESGKVLEPHGPTLFAVAPGL